MYEEVVGSQFNWYSTVSFDCTLCMARPTNWPFKSFTIINKNAHFGQLNLWQQHMYIYVHMLLFSDFDEI